MTDGAGDPAGFISTVGGDVATGLDRLLPPVTAADLFGPPVEVGDRVLLTAATVQRAGGFGFGGGVGRVGSEAGAGGGGGGGGGGIEGRPVAVIEVGPHGVTVRPIVDLTRLTIALLAALVAWRRAVRRMVG